MTTAGQRVPAGLDQPPQSRPLLGRTALLGLTLFLVSIGTFAPESAPDPGTATATEIRRFAADNAGTIQLNTLAALLSVGLFVFFVAGLAQQIRQARRDSVGPNVMMSLAGVVAVQILFLTAVASIFGRPEDLADVTDDAIVTLYLVTAISEWLYTLTVLAPCMVLVATYSWLAVQYRLIARWVSWAGFAVATSGAVTAIALVVPSNEFDPFLVPLFGWWLWPLAVGGALGTRWWKSR